MQKASSRKKGEMRLTEEIYGDVLFIINFSMDFLSLYIAGRILHLRMKAWRVMAGASLGALYGVLELLIDTHPFLETMLTAGILLLMCLTAFGAGTARTFFSSAALAGGAGTSRGTGGMQTKLRAARIANDAGCDMIITNGERPDDLYAIIDKLPVGTRFFAKK